MAELRPYNPSWRDKIAAALMGNNPSNGRRNFVSGMMGSTGLGTTGMGLVDITPAGIPMAVQESRRDMMAGNPAGSALNAMAVIPGAKIATEPLKSSAHKIAKALAGNLPMDDASRMARAKQMGFNVDEPVYHETNKTFREFKPQYGTQVWFTTDPSTFGENGAAAQGKVVEAYLRHKKLAGWNEYDKYGTDELMAMGYDGARLDSNIVMFDPSKIRSPQAAFNPDKINSKNIYAGLAPFGILGGGGLYGASQAPQPNKPPQM